ncbi:hypothetical protein M1523_00995 [Patescibacteria group bacterium]|nr:hypothetical protein [Patescibacteria group bacterium]MCL5091734.1 hypothetical protein [Patescibacteria group bacterium]
MSHKIESLPSIPHLITGSPIKIGWAHEVGQPFLTGDAVVARVPGEKAGLTATVASAVIDGVEVDYQADEGNRPIWPYRPSKKPGIGDFIVERLGVGLYREVDQRPDGSFTGPGLNWQSLPAPVRIAVVKAAGLVSGLRDLGAVPTEDLQVSDTGYTSGLRTKDGIEPKFYLNKHDDDVFRYVQLMQFYSGLFKRANGKNGIPFFSQAGVVDIMQVRQKTPDDTFYLRPRLTSLYLGNLVPPAVSDGQGQWFIDMLRDNGQRAAAINLADAYANGLVQPLADGLPYQVIGYGTWAVNLDPFVSAHLRKPRGITTVSTRLDLDKYNLASDIWAAAMGIMNVVDLRRVK